MDHLIHALMFRSKYITHNPPSRHGLCSYTCMVGFLSMTFDFPIVNSFFKYIAHIQSINLTWRFAWHRRMAGFLCLVCFRRQIGLGDCSATEHNRFVEYRIRRSHHRRCDSWGWRGFVRWTPASNGCHYAISSSQRPSDGIWRWPILLSPLQCQVHQTQVLEDTYEALRTDVSL